MKKWLPNILTLGNLLCGVMACIVILYSNDYYFVFLLAAVALLFDFFDGFLARMLNVSGELGKQLDSLADAVTFGVLPGMVMFVFLGGDDLDVMRSQADWVLSNEVTGFKMPMRWEQLIALVIPIFSIVRLAKFNIDTRQSDSFIGLPTPANAMFWMAIPLIDFQKIGYEWPDGVLMGLILVFSLLLVSEIPLFSLKFKSFEWKKNQLRYVFLLACAAILFSMAIIWDNFFAAFPIIIILYLILSVVHTQLKKKHAV